MVGYGQRRSLDDYEVEDFVLMATVNGTLSARDRKTGRERWQIHTEDAAVQTINHRVNSSSTKTAPDQDDLMTWIVEPSEDGELLFYTPEGGLEKLGVTVKDIIQSTPYMPPGADMVYNGAKNTTTYAIDAKTGVIQRVFSTGGLSGVVNDRKCKTTTRLSELDDECDSTDDNSNKIIMLGRTEYTIRIQRWSTAELLWTIKFNEWSPNKGDLDLRQQYHRSLDNRYIYSAHDGTIFGFDDADSKGLRPPKYYQKMESPVVRIFDVVRSTNSASYDLLVLPQPSVRSPRDEESSLLDSTFVGCTDNGGWYALSEANFPYVTRQASNAVCYAQGAVWKSLPAPEREKSLVGIHKMHYAGPNEPYPAIPALPASSYEGSKEPTDAPPSPQPSPAAPKPSTSSGAWLATLALCLAAMPVLLFVSPMMKTKSSSVLSEWLSLDHRILTHSPIASDSPTSERVEPLSSDAPVITKMEVEVPEMPELVAVDSNAEKPEEPKPDETQAKPEVAEVNEIVKVDSVGQILADVKEVEKTKVEEEEAAKTPIVRFKEPEPAEVPVTESGTMDGGVGGEITEPPVTPKKKPYKRGRRGGKKKSGNSNQQSQAPSEGEMALSTVMVSPAVLPAEQSIVERTIPGTDRVGRVTVLSTGNVEPDSTGGGYHVLNNLEIWEEEILGTGSQGTTVHRGRWEGKAVAVKRMLTHHVDIAMREVKTLQDADFHPNIVRYFCQQQRQQFLYIALELCEGSLYDVITKPDQFPEITSLMETKDTVNQICQGINHLHSLKIVHRDIKPQNILVGKPNPKSNRPRFLISDFGLCKKLHQDEYSFGATTAQHAGTIGWRAPELLYDCVAPLDPNDHSGGSGSGTGSEIVLDPLTKRRATRAIDIFPLGCVFHFVFTRGGHPFGDRWEREHHIVRGNSGPGLRRLAETPDVTPEAVDLVAQMIQADPKKRPDTAKLSRHPYFWDAEKRLEFVLSVSDRFELEKEKEKNDKGYVSPFTPMLEEGAPQVVGTNWLNRLDQHLKHELVNLKRRGYDGGKVLDLLRAIRNKKHHFLDMDPATQQAVGEPPEAYLHYFTSRFPDLLLYIYDVIVQAGFYQESRFKTKFFTAAW